MKVSGAGEKKEERVKVGIWRGQSKDSDRKDESKTMGPEVEIFR